MTTPSAPGQKDPNFQGRLRYEPDTSAEAPDNVTDGDQTRGKLLTNLFVGTGAVLVFLLISGIVVLILYGIARIPW